MRHQHPLQHKQLIQQLKTNIGDKNLPQIEQTITQGQQIKLPYTQWSKYLPEIFAMLTDAAMETPTFSRRAAVFRIFNIAISRKISEVADKQTGVLFKKNLQLLIRIIATIFIATASRRNIQSDVIQSFHKCICKFLGFLSASLQHISRSTQLPLQKIKVLSAVYPMVKKQASSSSSNNCAQFIYPDLLLWYEFFIKAKNLLTFSYHQQTKAIQHLARIRSEVEQNQQPILIWVSIYTFLQESIRVCLVYGGCPDIQGLCIRIVKIMMKEICQKFTGFLIQKQRQQRKIQDYQNFFKCMIRFNTIQVAYCQIQHIRNATKADTNILGAIQQTKKTIKVILNRCQEQKYKLAKYDLHGQVELYAEKVIKYQCVLSWIYAQLQAIQAKLFTDKTYSNNATDLHLIPISPQLKNSLHVTILSTNLTNFQKLMIKTISHNREQIQQKFSEGRSMSDLVIYSNWLLNTNPQSFSKCIQKVLEPAQAISFYVSLITQYNINNRDLILICIKSAQQVLQQQLITPQQIKTTAKIKLIKYAISLLSLSIQSINKYICNYCSSMQPIPFCQVCSQACIKFVYPSKMPIDMGTYWWQYINIKDYFVNNQLNRVPECYKSLLCEAFTAFCTQYQSS